MAVNNLKGLTIEVGGNTTPLNKALSSSNKEARSLATEIRSVEKALKMDPGNIDLIKQKQKLLSDQIGSTKDKLNTLKTAQQQFIENGGKIDSDAYRELDKQIVLAEGNLKKLIASQSGLSANMESLALKTQAFGGKAQALGKSFMPLTVAIAGIAVASAGAWKEIDKALDTVATKTGATGKNLENLQGVFKDVYGSFPTTAEEASNAVGEINTRLGFTGDKLETASVQFLKFAQVNGTDVNSAVQLVTRAMGDAGIKSDEYGDLLDMLTAASAASGISIERLTENITKYGAPMRQLGYDTKESVALFAQWEKAGVNTEIAFAGMKKAIGNFAKEGKDAKVEMQTMMKSIKECGSLSDATAMAVEVFGTKAGPDLADAIYNGRFSLEEMMKVLDNSSQALNNTFEATLDPADKAKVALNNLKMVGADIFEVLQQVLAPTIEALAENLADFREGFEKLSPSMQQTIVKVGAIVAAIAPALLIFGKMSSGIGSAIFQFGKMKNALFGTAESVGFLSKAMGFLTSPIGIVVAAVAALAAGLVWLYNNNEGFKKSVNELISKVMPILQTMWTSFTNMLNQQVIPALASMWTWFEENIIPVISALVQTILENVLPILEKLWIMFQENILPVLLKLWTVFVEHVLPVFMELFNLFVENILPVLQMLVDMFVAHVLPVLATLAEFIIGTVIPIIMQLYIWFAENLLPIITALASFIIDVFKVAFDVLGIAITVVSDCITAIIEGFTNVWKWLEDVGVIDAFTAVWEALGTVLDSIIDSLKWIWENASNILDGIGDFAGDIGSGIGDFVGWINPFDSGGFGDINRGPLSLTTNINVTNNGTPISASTLRQWGNTITDIVDDNLGRRGR